MDCLVIQVSAVFPETEVLQDLLALDPQVLQERKAFRVSQEDLEDLVRLVREEFQHFIVFIKHRLML